MWDLLGWIVFGGIAGWLASIFTGRNQRQGCLMNIIVGIVGAFVGGLGYSLISGGGLDLGFALRPTSLVGFVVAVIGAVVLLVIVNLFTKNR
jgi:uncharacterized membrane protein YeaQ/YmgE (transglycosylase-associated protein family)